MCRTKMRKQSCRPERKRIKKKEGGREKERKKESKNIKRKKENKRKKERKKERDWGKKEEKSTIGVLSKRIM